MSQSVCKWCKEEISRLQDGGWIGPNGMICNVGSGWHEPSPTVPEQTVPKTQQEWIDFYRKYTAKLDAELARAEATIAELVEALRDRSHVACIWGCNDEIDITHSQGCLVAQAAISRATGKGL